MRKTARDAPGLTATERLETFGDGVGVLAFVSPWSSVALHVLLVTLFALPERRSAPRQTTRPAAAT